MIRSLRKNRTIIFLVLAVVLFALLTLANFQFTKESRGGYEFFGNWLSVRKFLTEGISPYSDQVALEIQDTVYGRPATTGENPYLFSAPLYSIILHGPFALIKNFILARAVWMTVLEISLAAIVLVTLQLTFWKSNRLIMISLLIFCFFGFQGVMSLLEGSTIILTTLLAAGILLAMYNKHDEVAGLLLAIITFDFMPVALFCLLIILWSIVKKRTRVITWFLGTLVLLLGLSFLLIPDWFIPFLSNFIDQLNGIIPGSPGSVLVDRWGDIGYRISLATTALITVLIVVEWWQAARAGSRLFVWTAMFTLTASTWIGLKINPDHYVLLYPALFLGLELLCERWKIRVYGIVLSILALLFFINWGIYLLTMPGNAAIVISSFLLIPMPFATTFLLYWSKWWVVKAKKIDLEPTLIEIQRQ